MKLNKLVFVGALLLTAGAANATVTFTATSAAGLKDSGGVTNIPSGTLVLLVVDNGANGFLNQSTLGAIAPSATGLVTDRGVLAANASTTIGQSFGGDLILGSFTMSGGGSVALALTGVTIAGLESKPFALVWFEQTAAQLAGGTAGAKYGIASGADWILPASDSGNYSFNGTTNANDSVFWQLGATTTAAQIGATGFFTGSGTAGTNAVKSSVFTVVGVPEPSAALLGAIGALGLLRRRRI